MKRWIYSLIGLNLSFSLMVAQVPKERKHPDKSKHYRREQVLQDKQEYLAKELGLTAEESKQLMPLIKELDSLRFGLWKQERELQRQLPSPSEVSGDEERRRFLDLKLDNRVKIAELERSYYKKFAQILSPQQMLDLERANHRFARHFQHKRATSK